MKIVMTTVAWMDYQTVPSIHQRRVMPLIVPGHIQIAPNSVDFNNQNSRMIYFSYILRFKELFEIIDFFLPICKSVSIIIGHVISCTRNVYNANYFVRQVSLVKTPYQIVMNMERMLAKLLTFPGHLRTVQGYVTYVINVGKKKTIKFSVHLFIENYLLCYFLYIFYAFKNIMAYLICPLSIEI